MAGSSLDSAVSSLEKLTLSVLVVFALWCLAYPTAIKIQDEDALARDLNTWLSLQDFVDGLPSGQALKDAGLVAKNRSGKCDTEERWPIEPNSCQYDGYGMGWAGSSWMNWSRFWISLSWPDPDSSSIAFQLTAHGRNSDNPQIDVECFSVQDPEESGLLYKNYAIALLSETPIVSKKGGGIVGGNWQVVGLCDQEGSQVGIVPAPKHANRFEAALRPFGLKKGGNIHSLTLDSQEVIAYLNHVSADKNTAVSVLGVPLDAVTMYASAGIICAGLAFWMLPSIVELHGANKERRLSEQAWVFCFNTRGSRVWLPLECALLVLSMFFACFPLIILWVQAITSEYSLPDESVPLLRLGLGSFGLIFSSAIFFVLGWKLHQNRRITRSKTEDSPV